MNQNRIKARSWYADLAQPADLPPNCEVLLDGFKVDSHWLVLFVCPSRMLMRRMSADLLDGHTHLAAQLRKAAAMRSLKSF